MPNSMTNGYKTILESRYNKIFDFKRVSVNDIA